MGRHIQPCRAASPRLPFTWISIIPKALFTGKGFVTSHLQISGPSDRTAQAGWLLLLKHKTTMKKHSKDCLVLHGLVPPGSASLIRGFQFILQFLGGILCSHSPHGVEWSAAAPQHITLCGHCGQHCLSWLGGSGGSHWLCCPSQSVGILETFLHVTRNTKEQAQPEPTWDKVLPQEPKWNLSVTEPEQISLTKGRATVTDPTLSNPQCRKSSRRVTVWDWYLYFRVTGVQLTPCCPSKERQHGLSHFGHPRNQLCLCYIWVLKETFSYSPFVSAQASEVLQTSLNLCLNFHSIFQWLCENLLFKHTREHQDC